MIDEDEILDYNIQYLRTFCCIVQKSASSVHSSKVYNGISRKKWITGFHEYTPQQYHACSVWNTCSLQKLQNLYLETNAEWGYSALCAIKLMGLTIFRNLASRYATGPNFAGEIVPDVYIISSLWGLQTFQAVPIFWSKLSSAGDPYLSEN